MTKIVLTGGHHNAALVVAKHLNAQGISVVWFGHRYATRGDTHDSAEYLEVKAAGFPFFELRAGRFTPNLRELLYLPLGFFQAFKLLRQIKPSAILTFGGYLGVPTAIAGTLLGIPLYLHEQTSTAGKANRLISRFASRIYLTWSSSRRYFPAGKSRVVGLPLRETVLTGKKLPLFTRARPVLLVMGGKQGSQLLNRFVFAHLPKLLAEFNLVHQTGTSSATGDYDRALTLKNTLDKSADNYLPVGYLGEYEIGDYFKSADLYFGRSGAHVTYELALLGLPAILVPFLHTHLQEQLKNAKYLADSGNAVILPQSELSLPAFMQTVKLLKNQGRHPLPLPRDASLLLIRDLLQNLHGKN